MDIRHKKVTDLTTTEYRACYNANYKWDGYMQGELVDCRLGEQPGIAILLWDGPEDKISSLIGWALLIPVKLRGQAAGTSYTKRVAKYTCQFWVKSRHRRKGYGKMLMEQVRKYDERPHVFPHDDASAALFVDYKVTVMQSDKYWIKRAKNRKAGAA